MRRDDFLKTGGPDLPPFAEDLVFWAPLTEGDLTDHISGETGTTSPGASVQWDDSKGMYLMSVSTTDSYGRGHDCVALKFSGNALLSNLAGHYRDCSVFLKVIEVSFTGVNTTSFASNKTRYFSCSSMKDVWETSPRANIYVDGSAIHYGQIIDPGSLVKICYTASSSGNGKVYVNSYVRDTGVSDSLANPLSLGIMDKNGHATSTSSPYNTIYCSAYIKDVRFYKRCLSASEVAQL